MLVKRVYINCYKYDFHFALISIASVRYWYPDIPIYLIKDIGKGNFDTVIIEKLFNVNIFDTTRTKFGWGFGKWEPLFNETKESFLVLDADTVIVGPVLDAIKHLEADFIVDKEIQSSNERFNEIYYDRSRIHEVNSHFKVPDYSFNEGQWFGTSGVLKRSDFDSILNWTEPPTPKYPMIIKQGAQGHLNYTIQLYDQLSRISVIRKKIMIWPEGTSADFIDIESIRYRSSKYPYIIHWAGFSLNDLTQLPRYDIILLYKRFINSNLGFFNQLKINWVVSYFLFEKRILKVLRRGLHFFKRYSSINWMLLV